MDCADGLDREPAEPCVRRVCVSRAEGAEGGHDRARLRVRMGVGRRLRADVRGRGRHHRAENLVSGVGSRFRPLPGAGVAGRRRGVRAGSRPRRAPVHAAVPGVRAEAAHAADRRRHHHRRARAAVHGRRGAGRDYGASLQRRAGHAGEPEICGGVPGALQEGAQLLFREHVQRRQVVCRGGRGGARPRRGRGGVSRRIPAGQGLGPAARTGAARRVRQPDRERLHPEGRAGERRAAEQRDRDLPRRVAVLEIQSGRVPEDSRCIPDRASGQCNVSLPSF